MFFLPGLYPSLWHRLCSLPGESDAPGVSRQRNPSLHHGSISPQVRRRRFGRRRSIRRRQTAPEHGLRAGTPAPHERVFQFRDLVLDHLYPCRRDHLAAVGHQRDRWRRGGHRVAGGRGLLLPGRAVHGAGGLGVPDRRRSLSLELDPRRQGLGVGHRVVQPRRPSLRYGRGERGRLRTVCELHRADDRSRPEQAHARASGARRDGDHRLAGAVQSLWYPRYNAAHRLQRLFDLRRRDHPHRRDASPCAFP